MELRLTRSEIWDILSASIDNADALLDAVISIIKTKQKHISLGLAELALEELGKSFTCLAYYSADKKANWKLFWRNWKDHIKKAHRGFFYEFFCLVRYEIKSEDGPFPSKRKEIPHEKEASFYVGFDSSKRSVIKPFDDIGDEELCSRAVSILGLLSAAMQIRDKLLAESEEYKNAFSDYARYCLENEIYQQDVLALLPSLKNGAKDYDRAIDDIARLFDPNNGINKSTVLISLPDVGDA
jgi:AbiV family abortive infection protein